MLGILCLWVSTLLSGRGSVLVQAPIEHRFELSASGEAVASLTAGCARCDWGAAGREAVALKLSIDGMYSQHLLLTRGQLPAEYRVLLGTLPAGPHRLTIERDDARSAKDAGEARVGALRVQLFDQTTAEYPWLSRAPMLHARPGSVEQFSDMPLMMYVEASPGDRNGYRYTVIFSHEDGGTPTDRLMATWGRSTDIEFVYGVERASTEAPAAEEYQGAGHEILPFRGTRAGTHPLLWVSTVNNMFSDSGSQSAVRFAPAPQFVSLDGVSREAVMDANPWLYAVMAAELLREARIAPEAAAGSGLVPDPRRFAYLEACGDVQDAMLAFDIGVERGGSGVPSGTRISWHATDRGNASFRIARTGCFRAAAPLPDGVTIAHIKGICARAYTRPPHESEAPLPPATGRVVLRRVNTVFMLDDAFEPLPMPIRWTGSLEMKGESPAVDIPIAGR